MRRVIIIGAGASGLMAAVAAAKEGAKVTVYDHNRIPGVKLSVTGNGRCNYTNTDVRPSHYHSGIDGLALQGPATKEFLSCVLGRFGFKECVVFFRELGIEPEIKHYTDFDESGYVYPSGMDAAKFRDRLYERALRLGVDFRLGVSTDDVRDALHAHDGSVIFAAGSNAAPQTGSDSSVYDIIKGLGVTFHTFMPALCPLVSPDASLNKAGGCRKRGEAVLNIRTGDSMDTNTFFPMPDHGCVETTGSIEMSGTGDSLCYKCTGEIQLGQHHISGIPVLQLSRYAAIALKHGFKVSLGAFGHDYAVSRTAGFERSQSASGGIDIREINPLTMESTVAKDVYFCGELVDIDGECGGYNLHFAWASGYIAGQSAAIKRSNS